MLYGESPKKIILQYFDRYNRLPANYFTKLYKHKVIIYSMDENSIKGMPKLIKQYKYNFRGLEISYRGDKVITMYREVATEFTLEEFKSPSIVMRRISENRVTDDIRNNMCSIEEANFYFAKGVKSLRKAKSKAFTNAVTKSHPTVTGMRDAILTGEKLISDVDALILKYKRKEDW